MATPAPVLTFLERMAEDRALTASERTLLSAYNAWRIHHGECGVCCRQSWGNPVDRFLCANGVRLVRQWSRLAAVIPLDGKRGLRTAPLDGVAALG